MSRRFSRSQVSCSESLLGFFLPLAPLETTLIFRSWKASWLFKVIRYGWGLWESKLKGQDLYIYIFFSFPGSSNLDAFQESQGDKGSSLPGWVNPTSSLLHMWLRHSWPHSEWDPNNGWMRVQQPVSQGCFCERRGLFINFSSFEKSLIRLFFLFLFKKVYSF